MHRALRIFLSAFWLIWASVFIPGHTRGAITIPGSEPARGMRSCCEAAPAETKSSKPTPSQRAHCAVCYLAAMQGEPPTVAAIPAPTCCVVLRAFPTPLTPSLTMPHNAISERGPPCCA